MTSRLRILIAQINPHLGAIAQNMAKIRAARAIGAQLGADLVVTPELSIAGYPPEDLVRKAAFLAACDKAAEILARDTADGGPALLIGAPWAVAEKVFNAAYLLEGGKIAARQAKHELPNYGVFDDKRVFDSGPCPGPIPFRGARLGVMICEDWWYPAVAETLAETGAEFLVSINASPFEDGKSGRRLQLAVARVVETGLPFLFCGQVCGQDELVFDGASFVLNADRALAVQLPAFEENFCLTEWQRDAHGHFFCATKAIAPERPPEEEIYRCVVLGLRDYVHKNNFPGVLLGLSGGIDSALSAAVAVDALGPDAVRAVMMPSKYTSSESLDDAADCARLLGIRYDIVPITGIVDATETALAPLFTGRAPDLTEENMQSRARGLLLMAISNKFGDMLLTTGNKSEMSTGYATLYGDMCGGYSVLKDVYKTTVFALSRYRNAHYPAGLLGPAHDVMPDRVITKPPSAELRPDQKDEDSLPPYAELDAILARLIEGEQSVDQVTEAGFNRATILRIWRMLDRAEYKRRQAPPGVKISGRAFGRDRRYPITNGFTGLIS
jgi:NAD+ synthase